MKIYYRVLDVNEKEGCVTVRYFTDTCTEDSLASEFDIDGMIIRDANNYPVRCRTDVNITLYNAHTMEDIVNRIQSSSPADWFKLQDSLTANNFFPIANANTLLHQTVSFDHVETVSNSNVVFTVANAVFSIGNTVFKGDLLITHD